MGGYIGKYLQGWMAGDLDMIQDDCAEDFVYDDPEDGRFTKAQCQEYREGLTGEGAWSDIVAQEADDVEAGWCWWHWTPEGKSAEEGQQGASVLKADADGVHLVRLAYHQRQSTGAAWTKIRPAGILQYLGSRPRLFDPAGRLHRPL